MLQKRLSRKQKGSANRDKARVKIARLQEHISNCRKDNLHKITHTLTHDSQVRTICMEDLNVKGMQRNHHLAQAVVDASFGMFLTMLEYKCRWYGVNLIKIDRFAPSSKTCGKCGHIYKGLKLSERSWTCPECGTHHDRDFNAACNIKDFGLKALSIKVMNEIQQAAQAIVRADALLIGASNGLSIAEGYHVFANNEMFRCQFGDFQQQYGIRNVIEGCFFHYPTENVRAEFLQCLVQHWVKEYRPSQVMKDLLAVVNHRDYFILTSNADTHLELSGFDAEKVFEVEGTFEDLLEHRPLKDKSCQANEFLRRYHNRNVVIFELGIGRYNLLIKQPLMQLANSEPHAIYITLNLASELYIPDAIVHKSIGLAGDIAVTLQELKNELYQNGTYSHV